MAFGKLLTTESPPSPPALPPSLQKLLLVVARPAIVRAAAAQVAAAQTAVTNQAAVQNTPDKPYKILNSDLAQKTNGEWFTDKDFHKFLNANGYPNEIGSHSRNNEWFKLI